MLARGPTAPPLRSLRSARPRPQCRGLFVGQPATSASGLTPSWLDRRKHPLRSIRAAHTLPTRTRTRRGPREVEKSKSAFLVRILLVSVGANGEQSLGPARLKRSKWANRPTLRPEPIACLRAASFNGVLAMTGADRETCGGGRAGAAAVRLDALLGEGSGTAEIEDPSITPARPALSWLRPSLFD